MSLKTKVYNQSAEVVKELELSTKIFGVKANNELIYQAVIAQQANQRPVLAHTKDRSEVRGGGKKPWKQKGTGRARVGSSRSPIWIGGGVTFGPTKDRNFKKKINQKMKQKAMFMALSDKFASQSLVVLESLQMADFKTKQFNTMLLGLEKKLWPQDRRDLLVIDDSRDEKVKYSGRNLAQVKIINLENINLLDLLNYKKLLLTEGAVKIITDRYSKLAS